MSEQRTSPVEHAMRASPWLMAVLSVCTSAVCTSAMGGPPTQAPCSYSVIKIGAQTCPFWGAMRPQPKGMNSFTHWVGYRTLCDLSNTVAIRWTADTGLTTLPLAPGTSHSAAFGINDAGVTVGHSGDRACVWQADGAVQLLPGANDYPSAAYAVNNAGTIVGYRWNEQNAGYEGFVWADGNVTAIDPSTIGRSNAMAHAVSNTGWVAGRLDDVGFRLIQGTLEVLQPLPGFDRTNVVGVDDAGTVVGESDFTDDQRVGHYAPTVWEVGREPVELPLLPGYSNGWCIGVASPGTIVGAMSHPNASGGQTILYVVWIDGTPRAIRPLIAGENPLAFAAPSAINAAGQIVGNGSVSPPGGLGAWILSPQHSDADLNNDCAVDGSDLATLLSSWGPQSAPSPADINGDSEVDGADLGALLSEWSLSQ